MFCFSCIKCQVAEIAADTSLFVKYRLFEDIIRTNLASYLIYIQMFFFPIISLLFVKLLTAFYLSISKTLNMIIKFNACGMKSVMENKEA
jgi:hypothetical protein